MMVFDQRRVSSQRGAVMMMQNLDEGEMDFLFAQDLCMKTKTDVEWVEKKISRFWARSFTLLMER
jgi:hypothetical protein